MQEKDINTSYDGEIKYINENFNLGETYLKNINLLKQICLFLSSQKVNPDIDNFICIIKESSKLESILQYIVDYHMHESKNKDNRIFSNPFMATFIEAYCILKEINYLTLLDGNRNLKDAEVVGNNTYMYFSQVKRIPMLTNDETKELFYKLKAGDSQAYNQIVEGHLRLVISIAKRYVNKIYNHRLSFDDLIEEGNIGLMKAINKFDVEKGFHFSTYAVYWIRQAIVRALSTQTRYVYLPIKMSQDIIKLNRFISGTLNKFNYEPSLEEISEATGFKVEYIKKMMEWNADVKSLNDYIKAGEDETTVQDFIADDSDSLEDIIMSQELKSQIRYALEHSDLNSREIDIIVLRFGLDGGRQRTLDEVGKIFQITRERARQIEAKALRKLRRPSNRNYFVGYIPDQKIKDAITPIRDIKAFNSTIYQPFLDYFKTDNYKEKVDRAIDKLMPEARNFLNRICNNNTLNKIDLFTFSPKDKCFYNLLIVYIEFLIIHTRYNPLSHKNIVKSNKEDQFTPREMGIIFSLLKGIRVASINKSTNTSVDEIYLLAKRAIENFEVVFLQFQDEYLFRKGTKSYKKFMI